MAASSSIFDRIRIKPKGKAQEVKPADAPCSHPGCPKPGQFRAPKGRDFEGQYFTFCAEHVRAYNATYDYFKGMDDAAMAKFRTEEVVGHRPTWKMGQGGPRHVDESMFATARAMRRKGVKSAAATSQPRYNTLALKALAALELDGKATVTSIKARYKALVKIHHPDANGGDRSSEDKLREIIQAYNYLKANKLV
jgi:hypothetical protein